MYPLNNEIESHKYSTHEIMSFDYLGYSSDCFVASGINQKNYPGILLLYKYKFNFWGTCPLKKIIQVKTMDYNISPYLQDCPFYPDYCERRQIATEVSSMNIIPLCPNETNNKE